MALSWDLGLGAHQEHSQCIGQSSVMELVMEQLTEEVPVQLIKGFPEVDEEEEGSLSSVDCNLLSPILFFLVSSHLQQLQQLSDVGPCATSLYESSLLW